MILKLIEVLIKWLLLSSAVYKLCCLLSKQTFTPKYFRFLARTGKKPGNIRTETEIVNSYIVVSKATVGLWYLTLRNLFFELVISCIYSVGVWQVNW